MPPDHDDDPFAYLYRPEGQSSDGQPPRQPRQPSSYHQVRPVGERTYGGQRPQQAYQPPQPNAYYAAPETQPGGPPPGGPGHRRQPPPEPRRNGLLIGAIAVVLAVVVGVGAAILFSGDESDTTAGGDPTTGTETEGTGGSDGGNGDDPEPSDKESTPADDGEVPAADIAALELGGGSYLDSAIEGARSPDGSYIAGLNTSGATVTWTFDLQGDAGQYHLYTTYAVVSDGQTLDFSVNGESRDDGIDLQDFDPATDEWENSWFNTWNLVDLEPGENTIQLTCAESCDAVIDQIFLSDQRLSDDDPRL
jgi:hypothetical protein